MEPRTMGSIWKNSAAGKGDVKVIGTQNFALDSAFCVSMF